jgi:carboxymethylenebutenolidase
MPREQVVVTTEDGDCVATFHTPSAAGRHPAVLVYCDAAGFRETFSAMGDGLAELGYAALVPDVYYRTPHDPFDVTTVFTDPAERARLRTVASSLTTDRVAADAGAFLTYLAGREEVAGTKVGTTGYCMGGRLSLVAAAHHPDRVAAAASFHGGNLAAEDNPDSPHLLVGSIRATVLIAAAENDRSFPREQYDRLDQALSAAGVTHTMAVYPAAHGFAVPDNDTYDEAAGDRHWNALAELYGATLH